MNLQPYEQQNMEIARSTERRHIHMSIEQCITAWLAAKFGRSESEKTKRAYTLTISEFRAMLQEVGLDVDSDTAIVAPLAQGFAAKHSEMRHRVTPNTYNQRLAILSSFYRYAIKHDVLTDNPIAKVERRVTKTEHAAIPLSSQTVKSGLESIDRSTMEGKRDYAILAILLTTGRRVSELSGLCYGHIQKQGNVAVVHFVRCKGNKKMVDTLAPEITTWLYEYLHAVYGADLYTLDKQAPVWVSFSDRCKGKAISARTIQRMCETYLGTSKVHATRHTWAVTMHKKGATLSQIGKGLGHKNLKTTSDYLEDLMAYENPYVATLVSEFGIK